MTAQHELTVAIVGAGMTGLTTAVLLARDGHRVTLLDRDPAPPPTTAEAAWNAWQRPGVSQFRQPHLMLPRWRHEIERELPELLDDLVARGAARTNLLHLRHELVTHGWQPGDERFDTVTARRPVLESALGRLAENQEGLVVRRGVRATGLMVAEGPRLRGVRTTAGDVAAELVVDAAGRRTPFPEWVRGLGGPAPVENRAECGFVYYSRHFRARGPITRGAGSVLTHHPSLSVLTLPGDLDTFSVVLVTSAEDRALRGLRDRQAWEAVARCSPAAELWVSGGEPISDVLPMAGIEDVSRSYQRDGDPIVTGVVAVGDSAAMTNPSLGRGATIGLLHACALRDVLAGPRCSSRQLVLAFAEATARTVTPWVEATTRFDGHRLGEMRADLSGAGYVTDDVTWGFTTALLTGADQDPVLARAAGSIAGMVAAPSEVFSDPAVGARIGAYLLGPRYPADGPTRSDLLAAVGRGQRVPR